jgi:hypothetical protein
MTWSIKSIYITVTYSTRSLVLFTTDSRRMRWAGHAARMRQTKNNAYKILVGKPKGKRPLGRPRRRWGNNIEMDFGE